MGEAVPLFVQQEVADEHGVDAGGEEAADGGTGIVDEAFAEQVEGRVVEDGESAGASGGLQKFPIERVVGAPDYMDADAVATEKSGFERLAVFLFDPADRS